MSDTLVLGLDVGGTTTRALVADLSGDRLGYGTAAGGNPTAHTVDTAVEAIGTAVRAALANLDPARVRTATIGLAGGAKLTEPAAAARFDAMWHAAGLRCDYHVVSDALVAFAAGTPEPDGTVLIAGTGAIATHVVNRRSVRIADGHGWLLGDDGSGFWLGRQAVRHTLRTLDRDGERSPLVRAVLTTVLGSEEVAPHPRVTVNALINAVTAQPPVTLSRLAPLVIRTAASDPAAHRIVTEAAAHLVETVATVRPADARSPIVFAGSVLTGAVPSSPTEDDAGDSPVARSVRATLTQRWPDAEVRIARDGAGGAAWLAATGLPELTDADLLSLHARLVQ